MQGGIEVLHGGFVVCWFSLFYGRCTAYEAELHGVGTHMCLWGVGSSACMRGSHAAFAG